MRGDGVDREGRTGVMVGEGRRTGVMVGEGRRT